MLDILIEVLTLQGTIDSASFSLDFLSALVIQLFLIGCDKFCLYRLLLLHYVLVDLSDFFLEELHSS